MNKLKFIAYKDLLFSKALELDPYSVMINPDSFKRDFSITYNEQQSRGSTSWASKFDKVKPENYSFDFIVDGTGVVNNEKIDVTQNIEHFLSVVYYHHPGMDCPPYVEIYYCELIMKCVLKSLNISYILFHPDSRPLRAKITCNFTAVLSPDIGEKKPAKKSPNTTKKREVNKDKPLPTVANEVYGNNRCDCYIDVATANNLNNFRSINGEELYFPPPKY